MARSFPGFTLHLPPLRSEKATPVAAKEGKKIKNNAKNKKEKRKTTSITLLTTSILCLCQVILRKMSLIFPLSLLMPAKIQINRYI
jgi:hypothetical protein